MSFSPKLDQLDSSQLGLLNYLALKGIDGSRVNIENDYYKLYTFAGGHATLIGWLGVLFFHGLIEREHDKGEDWYRITRKGADCIDETAERDPLSNALPVQGQGREVVIDARAK